jgi:hypothetical protein
MLVEHMIPLLHRLRHDDEAQLALVSTELNRGPCEEGHEISRESPIPRLTFCWAKVLAEES